MEQILIGVIGRKLDINCGPGAVFGGEVESVGNGVVKIKTTDDGIVQISIDKIIALMEANEHASRPGFIG